MYSESKMNTTSKTLIKAPPYHVQLTAQEIRGGYPYFSHHSSVSALWKEKWRPPCSHGIYPFTDGNVMDFDPIFAELVRVSGDNPDILARPDDYAVPFLPVAETCISGPRRFIALRDSRSTGPRLAKKHGKGVKPPISREGNIYPHQMFLSPYRSHMRKGPPATTQDPFRRTCVLQRRKDRKTVGLFFSSFAA